MKRLLAAYPTTDVYQIATVFRQDEQGRFHNSQFSMLEWYRVGMNHHELMQDVELLLRHVCDSLQLEFPGVRVCSYSDKVYRLLGAWPDELSGMDIRQYFLEQNRDFPEFLLEDKHAALDLLLDEFIVSDFDNHEFTMLHEYPASQAALARVGEAASGQPVASRFEVFKGRVELANGFHELEDAQVQEKRFMADLALRQSRGIDTIPMDRRLLAALDAGLPDCAGVALGLERLQMVLGDHQQLEDVMCFPDHHA